MNSAQMPIYRASGFSGSRKRSSLRKPATVISAVEAFKRGKSNTNAKAKEYAQKQSNIDRDRSFSSASRLQGAKQQGATDAFRARAKSAGEVSNLRREQRQQLNKLINEIYAADFTEDCGLFYLLLKHLQFKDKDLTTWQDKLFESEVSNIKAFLEQMFNLL